MARRLRLGLIAIGALLLVLLAGASVFVATFDPNTQKTRITDAVRRATGRDLTLAGPLTLSLGLTPGIAAQDVSFANRPGGTRPQMATAARVEARIALLPLLTGRVELAGITLVRPDILLETDANGIGNWQVQRPAEPSSSPDTGPHTPRQPIVIQSLHVENGRLTWRNGRTGRSEAVDLPQATVAIDATSTTITADAATAAATIHLDAALGTPAQLTGAVPGPFPAKITLTGAGATFAVDGTTEFPMATHGFQGHATATVPDLAALTPILAPLLPITLPPLHDVRLDATLSGTAPASLMQTAPLLQTATLHIGASDLSRYQPGAMLNQLDLTYPATGQPAHLQADGTLSTAPWRLAASVLRTAQGVALRGLNLESATADAQGDIAVTIAPRTAVTGTLVSHHLDLDQLRRLTPPAPPDAPPASPVAPAPPQPTAPQPAGPLFSTKPLPWSTLRAIDADLQATIDRMELDAAQYHAVSAHLVLHDGALRLGPVALQAPEGHIDASLTADAAPPQPTLALLLRSPAFALDPLAQAFGLPGGSAATVELDAALQSAGLSPHDLAAHLDGHVGLAMVDGSIANATLAALLGPALGPVARSAGAALDPAGHSEVRCAAVRINLQAGQATLAALKLDTARLGLDGTGTADLGAETLALRLRPTLRVGGAGVTAPVRVDGPLSHPAGSLDTLGQVGRAGVVIGGLATTQDSCTPELTAARDGRAGRLPVDAPPRSIKPADLLRSLLR